MVVNVTDTFNFNFRGRTRKWVVLRKVENNHWRCRLVDGIAEADFENSMLERIIDTQRIAQDLPLGMIGLSGESDFDRGRSRQDCFI